jgi:hypothetical protein
VKLKLDYSHLQKMISKIDMKDAIPIFESFSENWDPIYGHVPRRQMHIDEEFYKVYDKKEKNNFKNYMNQIVSQVKNDMLKKCQLNDIYCSTPSILETRPKVRKQGGHIDFSERCLKQIEIYASKNNLSEDD